MRKIILLCLTTVLVAAVLIWRVAAKPSKYGQFVNAPHAAVAALVERPQEFLGKRVSVEGKITEQCKAMGCYFVFRDGERSLRVNLEDVAMTAPMHEGKPARVEGQLLPYGQAYQLVATAVEFL
jgi:uncharacterized protein YdeI (BOF family)